MTDNRLADLSLDFAVKILGVTDTMKGHYALVNPSSKKQAVIP